MEPTQCIRIACIKIWSRVNVLGLVMHVLRYGAESRKPTQCIKIGSRLNALKYGAESRKPTQCLKIGNRLNVLKYGAKSRKPTQE